MSSLSLSLSHSLSVKGPRILDEVLTPLLNDLSSAEKSEVALDGLKQVMAVKSKVVLPQLIPQLVKPPANTKALALLSSVAGNFKDPYLLFRLLYVSSLLHLRIT